MAKRFVVVAFTLMVGIIPGYYAGCGTGSRTSELEVTDVLDQKDSDISSTSIENYTYYILSLPGSDGNALFKIESGVSDAQDLSFKLGKYDIRSKYSLKRTKDGFYLLPVREGYPIVFIPGNPGDKPDLVGVAIGDAKREISNPGFFVTSSMDVVSRESDNPRIATKDKQTGDILYERIGKYRRLPLRPTRYLLRTRVIHTY